MANFSYKETRSRTLKVKGELNAEDCLIEIDGAKKTLSSLLREYDGEVVTFTITNKEEEDLPEPLE